MRTAYTYTIRNNTTPGDLTARANDRLSVMSHDENAKSIIRKWQQGMSRLLLSHTDKMPCRQVETHMHVQI